MRYRTVEWLRNTAFKNYVDVVVAYFENHYKEFFGHYEPVTDRRFLLKNFRIRIRIANCSRMGFGDIMAGLLVAVFMAMLFLRFASF
jgi:hypothetical protein